MDFHESGPEFEPEALQPPLHRPRRHCESISKFLDSEACALVQQHVAQGTAKGLLVSSDRGRQRVIVGHRSHRGAHASHVNDVSQDDVHASWRRTYVPGMPTPSPVIPGSRALGQFVQRRRIDIGIERQDEFGELLNWSRKTVSRLETGQRGLYDEGDVVKLARGLDVSESQLWAFVGHTDDGQPVPSVISLEDRVERLEREVAELRAFRVEVRQLLQARDVAAAGQEAAKLADAISERSPARGDRS